MKKQSRDRRKRLRAERRKSPICQLPAILEPPPASQVGTAAWMNANIPSFSDWFEKKGAKLISEKSNGGIGAYLLNQACQQNRPKIEESTDPKEQV